MFDRKKRILITAGGTKEYIDPIRYISNDSSGKMGISIADASYDLGFDVTLVCTFNLDKPYKTLLASSAFDMKKVLLQEFLKNDVLIMAAAVSDFTPKKYQKHKIKSSENITLELIKTPDILKDISKIKKPEQKIIGFALETENLINNAKEKLKKKNLDYIIANESSAIGSDYNRIIILNQKGEEIYASGLEEKSSVAKSILEKIMT